MEQIEDRVDRTKDGDLVVKFAKTGVTKRFQRISINHSYRGGAKNFSIAVFLEVEDEGAVNLVFEAHDFDYDNTPKLRRCVVERFEDEGTANIALALLTEAIGGPAAVRKTVDEEDDLAGMIPTPGPHKRSRWKSTLIWFALCSVLIGGGTAAVLIGGSARSVSTTARAAADGPSRAPILPNPTPVIGPPPTVLATRFSGEPCDGSEELCTTISTQGPAQAMKTLADLVKAKKDTYYKLKVQLVEDDVSNAFEKKE
ncbi:hypothetical protein [Duganella sp. LjRoot269]|uniref:hypothetical protein n=1 Tax=Duganella sp. LjRoot269 TaxID=3342305 RepID=UPI003ECF22C5